MPYNIRFNLGLGLGFTTQHDTPVKIFLTTPLKVDIEWIDATLLEGHANGAGDPRNEGCDLAWKTLRSG